MGITEIARELEEALEEYLQYREVTLFPTGWTAGYGVVKMLARPGDHAIMDVLSHACLQEGAQSPGAKIQRFSHLSNGAVRSRLENIRSEEPEAGILVITETLFSMDSDTPDLAELQAICHAFNATLLVDCAHDLGCIGPDGLGVLAVQDMVGKIDVLIERFQKLSPRLAVLSPLSMKASGRLFVHAAALKPFTNAMTPIQAGVLLEVRKVKSVVSE